MSWSLTTKAPKAEARAAFAQVHRAQPAYANDGAHKAVMDEIAAFAANVIEAAPDGVEGALSSSGHVGTDGTGSLNISLSFYRPV